jgi:hypothetical protein
MPNTFIVPTVDEVTQVSTSQTAATQQLAASIASIAADNTQKIATLQAEIAALKAALAALATTQTPPAPVPAPKKYMLYSPLYVWPFVTNTATGARGLAPAWQKLIDVKKAHPNLTVAAVVNPDNGDFGIGNTLLSATAEAAVKPNADFLAGIAALKAAGVDVYGYIYTKWGARSQTIIVQRARLWQRLYAVNKIMWDEMDNTVGRSAFYFSIKAATQALGFNAWIGNPGTPMPAEYLGSCSCIIVYEHVGLPTLPDMQARCMNGTVAYDNFGLTPHTVDAYSSAWVTEAKKYAAAICVHNDGADGNAWNSQTTYLEQLANDLDPIVAPVAQVAPASTTTTTTTTTTAAV